jgi:hypothetical protein
MGSGAETSAPERRCGSMQPPMPRRSAGVDGVLVVSPAPSLPHHPPRRRPRLRRPHQRAVAPCGETLGSEATARTCGRLRSVSAAQLSAAPGARRTRTPARRSALTWVSCSCRSRSRVGGEGVCSGPGMPSRATAATFTTGGVSSRRSAAATRGSPSTAPCPRHRHLAMMCARRFQHLRSILAEIYLCNTVLVTKYRGWKRPGQDGSGVDAIADPQPPRKVMIWMANPYAEPARNQVRRPLRPATCRFGWDSPMRRVFLSRDIEGATDAGRRSHP